MALPSRGLRLLLSQDISVHVTRKDSRDDAQATQYLEHRVRSAAKADGMIRRILFLLLRVTAVPFVLREIFQRNRVTILCYHDPDPDTLDKHLRFLSRHYNFVSLQDYLDCTRRKHGVSLPIKSLILTLDDGHRGNAKLKNVLERHNVSATIFVCSDIAGTSRHFWWNAGLTKKQVEELKHVPDSQRLARLSELGFDERREYPDRQALSDEEIAELRSHVEFQAHTRFHPVLPRCDRMRATDEIEGSKFHLESRFGFRISALAYPNGDYSKRDVDLVRNAGYQCALTLDPGYNSVDSDPFRLKRVPIYDSAGVSEVCVKASGFWEVLRRMFARSMARTLESVSVAANE